MRFRNSELCLFATRFLPLVVFVVVLTGCATQTAPPADWAAWQAKRTESIGGNNGWTTVIGLHWLKEGNNSAGAAATNQIVIQADRTPARIGTFTRSGNVVVFTAAPETEVRVRDEKISRIKMRTDAEQNPTRLKIGAVSIVAIERGDRLGLRVRDPESAARREFQGLGWFPYNPAWRLEGQFVPFATPEKLRVLDVTGATQEFDCPGGIVFLAQGSEHRLVVAEEAGESDYFVMFRDETSGDSTYASGRFLSVSKPDARGRVVIDFNRAYTPPCGFTAFATCPVPPRQNWLKLAVKAGELNPHGH